MVWDALLKEVKTKNNSLYAVLRSGQSLLENDELTIVVRFRFHRDRLREPENMRQIKAACAKVFRKDMDINVVLLPRDYQFGTREADWIGES